MKANINVRQVLLKRGNTAVSSLYTGPAGELTVDTTLKAIRVHDGSTPGGWLQASSYTTDYLIANITEISSNVTSLWGNAAIQQEQIDALIASPSTASGPTPPADPIEGSLWYDTDGGRLYVYYDNYWVDASPENFYTLPTASISVLGGVKVGDNLSIDGDGILSALPPTNLGNLFVNDQTISGNIINHDIVLAPLGTGTVEVPSLKVNGYANITTGSEIVTNTIDRLILASSTFSSTEDLQIGDYGITQVIPAPWTVFEFTTTPTTPLQIGDHISGPGIPAVSYVVYVGSGPYENFIITNQAPVAPISTGIQVSITRERTNEATIISATDGQVDISLRPSGEYGRITAYSSIHPAFSGQCNLGTPARRWGEIWIGPGTIYVQDETTNADLGIGARDGNLYVAGASGLTVGEFTFYGNAIAIKNPTEEIQIGTTTATGNVNFNRPIKLLSNTGVATFSVTRGGQIYIKQSEGNPDRSSLVNIIGNDQGISHVPIATGGMLQITGHDNVISRIVNDSFGPGNVYSIFNGRTAGGSAASPTGTPQGFITRFTGTGWDPILGFNVPFINGEPTHPVSMDFIADQTFSANNQPTSIQFNVTTAGNNVSNTVFRITTTGVNLPLMGTGVTFPDGSVQTTAADSVVITANLAGLTSNAASQQTDINTLFSNAANQQTSINTLFSNAATQDASIISLWSNAASQQTNINTLFANAITQDASINSLWSNAASQQTQINSAVTTVTSGYGVYTSRTGSTVGIDNTGVYTVAGTTNQVYVNAGVSAANAAITLSLPQSIAPSSSPTFSNVTITGNLVVQGNIVSADTSTLDSKILYLANNASSASELDGGGIILGNINADFKRSFLYRYNGDYWDTDGGGLHTLDLIAGNATITGNLVANGSAHFGGAFEGYDYPNAEVQIDCNVNGYNQIVGQNHNSGTNASFDFVAVNDIGDDENHYIDLGINSSNFTMPEYSIMDANSGYLYVNGGNLNIGTQTAGNVIKIHTSGTTADKLRVTIDDSGINALGNVSATYFVGSGLYLTDIYSNANVASYLSTDSNITAIWANIASINAAWQANAAYQENEISAANSAIITANTGMKSYVDSRDTAITNAWTANAASQQVQIDGLNSNIIAANSAIITANTGMKSYVDARDTSITSSWTANAASQQVQIDTLNANLTAANSQIVTNYNNSLGYASSLNLAMLANVNAANASIAGANAAIITANTGMKSYVDYQISTANSGVVSYVNTLNSAMIANVSAANSAIVTANSGVVSYVNTQISTVGSAWTANAAFQENEISALRANITAANLVIINNTANIAGANAAIAASNVALTTYINTQISTVNSNWQANAAFQEDEITALRANITAANLNIVGSTYSNANVAAYLPVNSTIIAINANIAGANAAIITANTGMKSYVDAQDTAISLAWSSNAQAQETAISGLRANITAANSAIQTISANLGAFETWANANFGTSSYSNVNVAAYLPIHTGNIGAGNIVATGNVTANNFIGNGIFGTITVTGNINSTSTSNIQMGNIRIVDQTISGIIYGRDVNIFVNNNGAQAGGANIVLNSNLMPTLNYVYTLGAKNRRWAKSYHGPKSIDIDGITLETDTDIGGANLYIGNATILNAPSLTSNTVMVATGNITGGNIVSLNSAFFYGKPVTGYDALYAGAQNGYTALPYDVAQFTGNGNAYAQVNMQNISTGIAGTTDYVATSNDGTDTTYYVNMGIAGNTYSNSTPINSLGTSLWPRDSYLYAQGNTAANIGGNLVIGTTTLTKTVKIIAGGINQANIIATYSNTGLAVAGNVTANYYQGDGSKLTGLPGSFGTNVLAGKLTVNPASVGKSNDAIQTFTLTGLTTSHKVVLIPGTVLAYGIFVAAAWASATDTLSVQFMNITGGSIDLGNIDLNYIAWV